MNLEGAFRDGLLWVTLPLPTEDEPLEVAFMVDTGFDGGMVLSEDIVRHLLTVYSGNRARRLADGSVARCDVYELALEIEEEPRLIEILVMNDGGPLLGTEALRGASLYAELIEGGLVQIEPL